MAQDDRAQQDKGRTNPYTTERYSGRTVRLELSRTARAFEPDERIWDRELHRMFSLVKEHVQALGSSFETRRGDHAGGRSDPLSGPLLSIAIFGTYGSGKSSLLKTFAREARSPRDREDLNKPEDQEIYSLPVIEPNLTSKDDHFLYSFLATALEEDLKLHRRERTREDLGGAHALSPVQQAFEKVSEYLQVIDSKPQEHTYDPLGLSLERLDRHTSDLRLREALSELIDTLADNLAGRVPRSVLILPVDDADMSLEKLRLSLDTYRRYLLHPRLVPVFSFTGRLAEELMQVHFAGQVEEEHRSAASRAATGKGRSGVDDRQVSHLSIAERLALQYLVKLFPIRNRILVGYAPARVQAASFTSSEDEKLEVLRLLETASHLLFGHPQWPIAPRVRLALRPATLRRQLQILDAMHDAGVHRYMGSESDGGQAGSSPGRRGWLWTFTSAAWSLLNVHRDVLRELDLHMEELLSWTPRGLRNEILRILLAQDEEVRQLLLRRWRYRIEDRRAQVLSLLAMTVYRPQMPGDELSGEDPDRLRQIVGSGKNGDGASNSEPPTGDKLSVVHGALWFLGLWYGFYLPQILGRLRASDATRAGDGGRLVAVGWNLKDGANSAISRATSLRETSTTGMMLLEPQLFADRLDAIHAATQEKKPEPEGEPEPYLRRLFIDLWCFYGYKEGTAWAAVSFWRGVGLLGQLIEDFQRLRSGRAEATDRGTREEHEERIRTLLQGHLGEVSRLGVFNEEERIRFRMVDWTDTTDTDSGPGRALDALATSLRRWVERLDDLYLNPMPPHGRIDQPEQQNLPPAAEARKIKEDWNHSFIRRLHGEYLLGELWPRVGGIAFEEMEPTEVQTAAEDTAEVKRPTAFWAVERWHRVLRKYFAVGEPGASSDREPGATIPIDQFESRVFGDCPLFFPWLDLESEPPEDLDDLEPRSKILLTLADPSLDVEPAKDDDPQGGKAEKAQKGKAKKKQKEKTEDALKAMNTIQQKVREDLKHLSRRQGQREGWDRADRKAFLNEQKKEYSQRLLEKYGIEGMKSKTKAEIIDAILEFEDPRTPEPPKAS